MIGENTHTKEIFRTQLLFIFSILISLIKTHEKPLRFFLTTRKLLFTH